MICLCLTVCGCVRDGGDMENKNTDIEGGTTAATTAKEPEQMETPESKYKNYWKYETLSSGLMVRHVTIKTEKRGDPIEIVQLTDLHFNYCDEQDLAEADPVLMSTLENRKWLANAKSLPNAQRALEYAKDADQLVITGDVLDYLSHGTLSLTKTYIFDAFPDAMVTLGNHEPVRQMQGTVAENTTLESRLAILQENWNHDVYYSSKVLGEKVMLIQMDNGSTGEFQKSQVEPLRQDLATAREKGYTVLLFYHIPLATGNPADYNATAIVVGDKNGSVRNLYTKGVGNHSTGASREVYQLITNNADIIAGAFCGHTHNDFYTEIKAKTASGEATVIPQYILIGAPYGKGHALRITVD